MINHQNEFFLNKTLPKLVEGFQKKTFGENIDDSNNLEGQGVNFFFHRT